MEFRGIEGFMHYLKTRFDESDRKSDWRALTGRDHVQGRNDTFIFTDEAVFQIKSVEVAPQITAAVSIKLGGPSPDMLALIKDGAPVPLNVTSRASDAHSVVMFGVQQYSSDVADLFRTEYYSCKQDELNADLDRRLRTLLERPEFRTSYKRIRESQEGYFA